MYDLNFTVWFKKSALLGASHLISKGKTFKLFFGISLDNKFFFREIKIIEVDSGGSYVENPC